jgi:hypothetical protein
MGKRETVSRVCRVAAVALALTGIMVGIMGMGTAAAQATSAPDCSTVGYSGTGTTSSPYEVTNVSQLQCMGDGSTSTSLSDSFEQTTDIDATGTDQWNGGNGFAPVGNVSDQFNGTFGGAGNDITGLTVNRSTEDFGGLFGVVGSPGSVEDTNLVDANITSNSYFGPLAGKNLGTVTGSSASGAVEGNNMAGGLIGRNEGTVTDSSADTKVDAANNLVGGFVGRNLGTVTDSSSSGNVTGDQKVGGFVGSNRGGTVRRSSATGNVFGGGVAPSSIQPLQDSGSDPGVGGFVGFNTNGGVVELSSATGSVESPGSNVGGFAGFNRDGDIADAYARGNVTGDGNVGGMVGQNGDFASANVTRTYATGFVSGNTNVGGLVGFNSRGFLNDSYWDRVSTNQDAFDDDVGASGPDASEIDNRGFILDNLPEDGRADDMIGGRAEASMVALDFNTTWAAVFDDYPIFARQGTDFAPVCSNVSYAGSGTASDPFEVTNADQLQCMGDTDTSTSLSDNFEQTTDIDATGTSQWNNGLGFDPVGKEEAEPVTPDPFNGTFDGSGNTITGLTVNRPTENNVGLFGEGGNAGRYTDVTLDNVDVSGGVQVGALIGFNRGGTVEASRSTGSVTGGSRAGGLLGASTGPVRGSESTATVIPGPIRPSNNDMGGLVGISVQNVVINSSASGNVTGDSFVGGLAGDVADMDVISSSASGNVDGQRNVGGLIGRSVGDVNVTDSSSTGDVDGSRLIGGFVGFNRGAVNKSFATGDVTSSFNSTASVPAEPVFVGGFAGVNIGTNAKPATVNESFATGDVVASEGFEVGGFVGRNARGEVADVHARGDATGDKDVGGVVGRNGDSFGSSGNVIRTYATEDVSGNTNVGGVVGNNSNGAVMDSYWDELATNQNNAVGASFPDGSESNLVGFSSDSDGDTRADEMTGDAAETNMAAFDFNPTWVTTDSYPELFWSVESLTLDAPATLNVNETSPAPSFFRTVDARTPFVTGVANYSSSDTGVLTVSSPLEGVGSGTATATAKHFGFSDTQEVEVIGGGQEETDEGEEDADCVNRRGLSRGQESQECPRDRTIERGGSREELDRETGRNSDTRRRDRSRGR